MEQSAQKHAINHQLVANRLRPYIPSVYLARE